VCLLLASLPLAAGTIEGTVELKSALKKRPQGQKSRFPRAPGSEGYEQKGPARATLDEVRNVVLFLVNVPGSPPEPGQARILQRNREFVPFVTAVPAGSTVEFPNGDNIYHSVYSESACGPFHLPEYPQGQSRTVTFARPGVVELFCAIHPHMNAYVLVAPNRFFAQPDDAHRYRLDGVPAGKYVLKAWHPLLEPVTRVVEVPASGTAKVDVSL
jgi:hypothetical protein